MTNREKQAKGALQAIAKEIKETYQKIWDLHY